MQIHKLLLFILSLPLGIASAQTPSATIEGQVTDSTGQGLSQVNILLANSGKGTSTNANGKFTLAGLSPGHHTVQIRSVGYHRRTRHVTLKPGETHQMNLTLSPSVIQMNTTVVTGTQEESYVKASPVKVQVVNEDFLSKNPSGNLMESIDQVNGVQQQVNCGVCGTNALRINGMAGPYTLMLIDGMPIMGNLASVYGLNGIPNSLIDQVEIVKGPNSTLYGSQAMGGIINVRTKQPDEMPLIRAQSQFSSHREWNTSVGIAPEISDKVQTLFSANYFRNQGRFDFNNDNFLDLVLNNRLSLFNKWQFDLPNDRSASIAGRYYRENRLGGTRHFTHDLRGSDSLYGESIKTRRFEVFGSYDLPFPEQDISIDASYTHHFQDSYYGTQYYRARQSTGFANLIWTHNLPNHTILTGLTGKWQRYRDNSPAKTGFQNLIPGVFVQDEWQVSDAFTLLSGLRTDHHEAHGTIFSPRLNMKYAFSDWTSARLNLGSGFRQVHLFTEDHAALTGTREVVIRENLNPERSFNATLNLSHIYQTGNAGTGNLSADIFYNYFTNRITPDYEVSPDLVVYRNLDGYGITRGFSLSASHDFRFPLTLKAAGTFQEAFQVTDREQAKDRRSIPFTPQFSGNFQVTYQWQQPKLTFAYTGQLNGPEPLPKLQGPFSRPDQSPWYTIQNFKISHNLNHHLEIYGGVKNIFNWTQPTPLVDPENPFGEDFDTIYAYGELQPRRFYVGLNWHWDK